MKEMPTQPETKSHAKAKTADIEVKLDAISNGTEQEHARKMINENTYITKDDEEAQAVVVNTKNTQNKLNESREITKNNEEAKDVDIDATNARKVNNKIKRPENKLENVQNDNFANERISVTNLTEISDNHSYYTKHARQLLSWHVPFTHSSTDLENVAWFRNGLLNACYNCVDRHASITPDKVCMIFDSNESVGNKLTYEKCLAEVMKIGQYLKRTYYEFRREALLINKNKVTNNELSNTKIEVNKLDDNMIDNLNYISNYAKGECVVIYMPMCLEACLVSLACSRLGIIHNVVFGGFNAESLSMRIKDSNAKIVCTVNKARREKRTVDYYGNVSMASGILKKEGYNLKKIIVFGSDEILVDAKSEVVLWNDILRRSQETNVSKYTTRGIKKNENKNICDIQNKMADMNDNNNEVMHKNAIIENKIGKTRVNVKLDVELNCNNSDSNIDNSKDYKNDNEKNEIDNTDNEGNNLNGKQMNECNNINSDIINKTVNFVGVNNKDTNTCNNTNSINNLFSYINEYLPCEPVEAEHPLFYLYTSGSTGKPKGIVHTTGGYLLYSALTTNKAFDVKHDSIFCSTADLGWITGHTYTMYGPLLLGATTVLLGGVPTFPNSYRFFEMVEKYRITHLYTAPTVIRMLQKILGTKNNNEVNFSDNKSRMNIHNQSDKNININNSVEIEDNMNKISCKQTNVKSINDAKSFNANYHEENIQNILVDSENNEKEILSLKEYNNIDWTDDNHVKNYLNHPPIYLPNTNFSNYNYDLSSLKILGSVGEPINKEAYRWFRENFGPNLPLIDTYWQTEAGGVMLSPIPYLTHPIPECASLPFYGMVPVICKFIDVKDNNDLFNENTVKEHINNVNNDEEVNYKRFDSNAENINTEIKYNKNSTNRIKRDRNIIANTSDNKILVECEDGEMGLLLFKGSWPGMARTILNNHERYQEAYLKYKGYYLTGDEAVKKNGLIYIKGRVDDVLNVSGHRLSTAEIESACCSDLFIVEAAVVGIKDELTGQGLVIFVVKREGKNEVVCESVIQTLRDRIGPIVHPRRVVIVHELPKTRTGKIMRRVLRDLLDCNEIGDLSTCNNPESIEAIKKNLNE
ncbi:hypothetical protein COBT_002222 [Conglomerata obtusa]